MAARFIVFCFIMFNIFNFMFIGILSHPRDIAICYILILGE